MSVKSQANQSGSTSHSLLQRVRQHEPIAWERFIQLYGPLVYRWSVTSGLQSNDAADIIQEVFHAVFEGIARFERNRAGQTLRGWLWTITRNKICDHFRRRSKEAAAGGGTAVQDQLDRLASLPETDREPLTGYAAELSQRALMIIQTEFETTTWQAFWAMAIDGLTATEAAERLGLTTAAVFKAKSRVLNRLRRELEGMLD